MNLTRHSIEILVDLVENKMFDMAEYDDDPRGMAQLKRCRSELIAIAKTVPGVELVPLHVDYAEAYASH